MLVVEDDVQLRHLLAILLERHGLEVLEAGTGAAAQARLAQDAEVAVVILDQGLPDTTGLALLGACPGLHGPTRPGVVALTGDTDPGLAGRFRDAGADVVLHKPFGPERLVGVVASLAADAQERRASHARRS
ncbi:response regulator [Nocardioides sp. GY 10127]|uniref:response regulator n=1 Tax=Nocardioides sp. GY 10127 TaxID=2569762 RepID=UPI001457FBB3|nr:response regulator [Nocardioides sp. GY 10127]